jgi:mono/diheme cytochrome c family protein
MGYWRNTMKALLLGLVLCTVTFSVHAAPFAKGNPQIGKKLLDKSCVACHASMFGGDGSSIYTRSDRKVNNPQQLLSRIRACNTNVGAGWYPEDEENVAAYLNATYYHFK